jgi:hypothetical protein
MQASLAYHSISPARVSQRTGRLAASFQSSIHGIDARANAALWIRAGLVVAVRAPRNVTQSSSQQGQQAGKPARRTGRMPELRPYGLPNNPLTAFQSVRAGLGGPARATRTGTFARFKMSRVKSPMM